jgi:hypothetical protein
VNVEVSTGDVVKRNGAADAEMKCCKIAVKGRRDQGSGVEESESVQPSRLKLETGRGG